MQIERFPNIQIRARNFLFFRYEMHDDCENEENFNYVL